VRARKLSVEITAQSLLFLALTISLGMAVYPDDARDRQMLIERADRALYAAKHGGRNQTCVYSKIQA